ncbi:globin family protein [Oceanobacillus kapialis]|uniref:Uncharacterized protein n=1 Tax=Oceanobacillus kapialis TaxID=481353 RepID=A0ABW5PZ75_9BACI
MKNMTQDLTPLLEEIVTGIYQAYPNLLTKYGEVGKKKCLEDNQHHLDHLNLAYEAQNTQIFTDYVVWLDGVLTSRGMDTNHLTLNLELIRDAVKQHLANEQGMFYEKCLQEAVNRLNYKK